MKTIRVFLIYILISFNFNVFSSIDEKENQLKTSQQSLNLTHYSKIHTESSTEFSIDPVYLTRNLSAITSFSVLPEKFMLTLEQSFLNYEINKTLSIDSTSVKVKNNSNTEEFCDIRLKKQVSSSSVSTETYAKATHFSDNSSSVSLGVIAKKNMANFEFSGEISYEEVLASKIASPSFQAALSGAYNFKDSKSSKIQVALSHAKESTISDLTRYEKNFNSGNVFDPDLSNISIVNLSLSCAPTKNMFMSIDYYYYLQDQLKIQSFTNALADSGETYTDGNSRELGQEINFTAVFMCSKNWKSEFFTGLFAPGEAYSNVDDTKTFEIRGEIIVNF